jgi:hypothetical protein
VGATGSLLSCSHLLRGENAHHTPVTPTVHEPDRQLTATCRLSPRNYDTASSVSQRAFRPQQRQRCCATCQALEQGSLLFGVPQPPLSRGTAANAT